MVKIKLPSMFLQATGLSLRGTALFLCMAGAASAGLGCVAKVDESCGRALAMPATAPTTQPVSALVYDEDVKSLVCPPPGWRLDPVKRTEKHIHKTWLSPTGDTAYGLIWIRIPVPLTESMVLWGFMDEMKKSEGEAILLAKGFDEKIDALRFEAEGGLYHIRVIMKTKGLTAYCVYAGTLRAKAVREDELAESIAAREATKLGEGTPPSK